MRIIDADWLKANIEDATVLSVLYPSVFGDTRIQTIAYQEILDIISKAPTVQPEEVIMPLLEKEIPKEILKVPDGPGSFEKCPSCNNTLYDSYYGGEIKVYNGRCMFCGQKILLA